MYRVAVEQGHLTGGEHQVDRRGVVDLANPCHLAVRVAHQRERPHFAMRVGNDAKAAVVRRRLGESDVRKHEPGLDTDPGCILVPPVERPGARLLDAEDGVGEQHVGPDQILDRIDKARVAAQREDPVEQQVGLDVERPLDRLGPVPLERFDPGPECAALRFVEHVDAREKAVLVKGGELGSGQPLAHCRALVPPGSRPAA